MKESMVTYELLHPGGETQSLPEDERLLFACCPSCSTRVCRAGDGTKAEQFCPKCGALIRVTVVGTRLTVAVVEDGPVKPAASRRKRKAASSPISS